MRGSNMPQASINDINIYYESTGEGFPLVLCHEFAGSYESWESQVRFFSRRYRTVTYNARGYPPSDVPGDMHAYSQEQHVADLDALMDHLGIERAYVCGLSMGGNVALHFGILHPEKAKALVVAGAGYGTSNRDQFRQQSEQRAFVIEQGGMEAVEDYARGPERVQLLRKDPRGWQDFKRLFLKHSAVGSSLTLRGVQMRRPTARDLEEGMRSLKVPTLILVGDEDEPSLEPSLFMKRCISTSGLVVFPQTGHTINLEEPGLFNRAVLDFLTSVESGGWAERG
jgi:pimeloyl-ACP methyl ester carboxylesterase